jgi:hypothetical protein
MDKHRTFLEKKCRRGVRGGVEIETMIRTGEGPSSGRPCAPRNAKRCRNSIHARAGMMAAKRETVDGYPKSSEGFP